MVKRGKILSCPIPLEKLSLLVSSLLMAVDISTELSWSLEFLGHVLVNTSRMNSLSTAACLSESV